jgi:hypothetical protein
LISSHRKLLLSKAMVVNVAEKPEQDSGRHGWERRIVGDVFCSNQTMIALSRKSGFAVTEPIADARLVKITKDLGGQVLTHPSHRMLPWTLATA